MMIRPGSVMTVRPPSWTSRRWPRKSSRRRGPVHRRTGCDRRQRSGGRRRRSRKRRGDCRRAAEGRRHSRRRVLSPAGWWRSVRRTRHGSWRRGSEWHLELAPEPRTCPDAAPGPAPGGRPARAGSPGAVGAGRLREASLVRALPAAGGVAAGAGAVLPVVRLAGAVHLQAGCLFWRVSAGGVGAVGAAGAAGAVVAAGGVGGGVRAGGAAVGGVGGGAAVGGAAVGGAGVRTRRWRGSRRRRWRRADAAAVPLQAAEVAVLGAAAARQAGGGGGAARRRRRSRWRRAAVPGVAAEPRRGGGVGCGGAAAGGAGRAGGGAPSAGASGLSVGADFFLGLRDDERRGLRMRCGDCKLRRRQSGRGKQHEAKVCHDDLVPGKVLAADEEIQQPNGSVVDQRLIIRPDCGGRENESAFISSSNGLRRANIHCAFRQCFQKPTHNDASIGCPRHDRPRDLA